MLTVAKSLGAQRQPKHEGNFVTPVLPQDRHSFNMNWKKKQKQYDVGGSLIANAAMDSIFCRHRQLQDQVSNILL